MASTAVELLRRRFGGEGSDIPYQEIEYLQANTNNYIDTQVRRINHTGDIFHWVAKVGTATSSARRFVAAFELSSIANYCEINVNNVIGCFLGNQSASVFSPTIEDDKMYDTEMIITINTSTEIKTTINGVTYTQTQTSAQSSAAIPYFSLYRLGASYQGVGVRIGRNKLFVNGNLERDFVPCRVGSTGYMYDKVSGTLFGNSGYGDFTLGNDV